MKPLVITTVFAAATIAFGQQLGAVRNRPADSISVKDFGAQGDGVKPCRSYTAILTLLPKNIPLDIVHPSNISEANNEI